MIVYIHEFHSRAHPSVGAAVVGPAGETLHEAATVGDALDYIERFDDYELAGVQLQLDNQEAI